MHVSEYFCETLYTKMHEQEDLSIGCNALEFLVCSCTQTIRLSLQKKFEVSSTYDENVKREIRNFCYNLFLSYATNRRTDTQTNR